MRVRFSNAAKALIVGIGAAWLAGSPVVADAADEYPSKPIQLIVPFAAGGGTDAMARVLAKELSVVLDTSVVVENRTGAGGRIGADYVAKAKPDGYRLMFAGPTVTTFLPILEPETMPFDAKTAFTIVSYFYKYDLVLSTSPDSNIKSVKELIDFMRASPKPVAAGTGGAGTSPHYAAVYLAKLTDTKVTPIHYRGSAQATLDTIANRLLFNFESVVTSDAHIKSGKLVGLAIASNTRSPALPDLPTIAESGLPQWGEVDWTQWSALYAPGGTPPEIVRKLHEAVTRIMQDPRVIASVKSLSSELMPVMSVEQSQAYTADYYARWEKVLLPLRPLLKQ